MAQGHMNRDPFSIELTRDVLLGKLANHYTTPGAMDSKKHLLVYATDNSYKLGK